MTLLRQGRRNAPRAMESSPLAPRDQGIRRQERPGRGAAGHKLATKMAQLFSELFEANDYAGTPSEIEMPVTPRPRRVEPLRISRTDQPPHQARSRNITASSPRILNTPNTRSASARSGGATPSDNCSANTRVEVRVSLPGRADERHVADNTVMRSSPPQPVSASSSSRSRDSGFFSPEPDHAPTEPTANPNHPSMRALHVDRSYDPEAKYIANLSAIDRLRREVKLSRDPRIQPSSKTTRCNIGEGSELEGMLLSEIASRLFRHDDWRWAFYYLLHHGLYDEATCITSIMRRELESAQPTYRRDDPSHACEHCIEHELLCVRLMVDEKGEKRFSVATLPRELKLVRANEKNLGYYIRDPRARR